jgi:hypothetical protein
VNFLDLLLEASSKAKECFTDQEIQEEVDTFLFGASDVSIMQPFISMSMSKHNGREAPEAHCLLGNKHIATAIRASITGVQDKLYE